MLPPMSTPGFQRFVVGLVLCSAGCAYGELRQVLRAQVASESNCPEISVTKSPPFLPGYKEHQFVVKGCNIDRIYNCPDEGMTTYGHANCTYVESAAAAKPPAPPAPSMDEEAPADDLSAPPPADEPAAGGDSADGM